MGPVIGEMPDTEKSAGLSRSGCCGRNCSPGAADEKAVSAMGLDWIYKRS